MEPGLEGAIQYIGWTAGAFATALIGLLAKQLWKRLPEERKAQLKVAWMFWRRVKGAK